MPRLAKNFVRTISDTQQKNLMGIGSEGVTNSYIPELRRALCKRFLSFPVLKNSHLLLGDNLFVICLFLDCVVYRPDPLCE